MRVRISVRSHCRQQGIIRVGAASYPPPHEVEEIALLLLQRLEPIEAHCSNQCSKRGAGLRDRAERVEDGLVAHFPFGPRESTVSGITSVSGRRWALASILAIPIGHPTLHRLRDSSLLSHHRCYALARVEITLVATPAPLQGRLITEVRR